MSEVDHIIERDSIGPGDPMECDEESTYPGIDHARADPWPRHLETMLAVVGVAPDVALQEAQCDAGARAKVGLGGFVLRRRL